MNIESLSIKILSVLDFVEKSKEWNLQELMENATILKNQLKRLPIEDGEEFDPIGYEVNHLIDFLNQLTWHIGNDFHTPGSVSDYDYSLIQKIVKRYSPDIYN